MKKVWNLNKNFVICHVVFLRKDLWSYLFIILLICAGNLSYSLIEYGHLGINLQISQHLRNVKRVSVRHAFMCNTYTWDQQHSLALFTCLTSKGNSLYNHCHYYYRVELKKWPSWSIHLIYETFPLNLMCIIHL